MKLLNKKKQNLNRNLIIHLFIAVFDMGKTRSCDDNYVEIQDLDTNNPPIKFCGTDSPSIHKSQTSKVSIHYKKETSFAGTGWTLDFFGAHEGADLSNGF